MKVYIGYKYTNVEDKNSLKKGLEEVSDIISDLGHTTFLLGRDKKNWSSSRFPLWKTIPYIFINLINSELLFAYIVNDEKSYGLSFELALAKLMKKKIIVALTNKNLSCEFEKRMADQIVELSSFSELKEYLAREL
ncbi:hypothetical protein JXA34_02685 [Patescibacteria group bacterium]|nr:hypothetical protein [Patescibacteria group bacterium]